MSWADLLKSIVCVLNLIACVRLTGPYLIPKWIGYNVLDSPMRDE